MYGDPGPVLDPNGEPVVCVQCGNDLAAVGPLCLDCADALDGEHLPPDERNGVW